MLLKGLIELVQLEFFASFKISSSKKVHLVRETSLTGANTINTHTVVKLRSTVISCRGSCTPCNSKLKAALTKRASLFCCKRKLYLQNVCNLRLQQNKLACFVNTAFYLELQ